LMAKVSIDASTRLIGVMGWPVKHSLSPAMHNAALLMLGLNWCYIALPVHPDAVGAAVRGLSAMHFRGSNVTVPHKQAVIPLLDEIDPAAAALGAVNTLVVSPNDDGIAHIAGYNTDVAGFLGDLRQHSFDPCERKVVIVGAGGAARGVAYALLSAGVHHIVVLNRTLDRAQKLVSDLADVRLKANLLSAETLVESTRAADLLVNATTVGMWPNVEGSIWPGGVRLPGYLVVYDIVYNPLETVLLRQARKDGAHPVDGLGMLARQGALALDMWTEESLDVDEVAALMRDVCMQELQSS
jgi:shikimate dehydrogenase